MKTSPLIFNSVRFTRGDFLLDVDVRFREGELTVILGPSGCGKTTLLDLAAGFLRPSGGSILEGERDVTLWPPDKRKVGVVFQDHALFPHLNVKDNVSYGPKVRGANKVRAGIIADGYLEMTHMTKYASRMPSSLSGGERQRVALARSLAIEPDILLLDEPFSSLDAALRRTLRNDVRQIQEQTGITAILVTHDQDEALALADELAVMRQGRIIQMGKSGKLWKNPADLFTALFLGRTTRLSVHRISSVIAGELMVETIAGTVRMEIEDTRPVLPSTLVIRPEDLIVTQNGTLSGQVTKTEYAGGHWKIRLEVGDGTDMIDCNIHDAVPPAIGDLLSLDIRPGSARILPGTVTEHLEAR